MPDHKTNPGNKILHIYEKGALSTDTAKPRNVYRDALFFSSLVLDKRFRRTVRFIDWVDLEAGPAETFSGAYLKNTLMEIPLKPRVLLVKASKGAAPERKPWVTLMVLYPSGFIYKTDIEGDASEEGWELEIREKVMKYILSLKHSVSSSKTAENIQDPETKSFKAGDRLEIVCSKKLEELLRNLPDHSPQAVIEFALHHVPLDSYLNVDGV